MSSSTTFQYARQIIHKWEYDANMRVFKCAGFDKTMPGKRDKCSGIGCSARVPLKDIYDKFFFGKTNAS